jgi:hypothetical protein
MLADQFPEAAAGARTAAGLDELARKLWRAHAEGHIAEADAEALSESIEARRAALAGKVVWDTQISPKATSGLPKASRRAPRLREKVFGLGRPRALDRNAKVRIMHWARCLSRRTEAGKAYGEITAKALAVLEALLWAFHNAKSGLCFPSYEAIAKAAHCARSTVAEAIRALEDAGVLTWVQRVKRVRETCTDLLGDGGWRWRVLRTSNAYSFHDPGASDRASKSEKPTETPNQEIFSSFRDLREPPVRAFEKADGDRSDQKGTATPREPARGRFRLQTWNETKRRGKAATGPMGRAALGWPSRP